MRRLGLIIALAGFSSTAWAAPAEEFTYNPAGQLTPGSGQGAAESTVFAPGMRFPIEEGPAYPNSQVWGNGGGSGPGGSQCDAVNYSYPWSDNYCESRSWNMPLCPSGNGHQGQDIRPATCDDRQYWQVASEAGTITNIGSYSVYVTAADGTRFDYLHGRDNIISSGQSMSKGERINKVSNAFGGNATTIHLHFNIRQDVAGVGFVYVSPYMSLVESYEELLGIDGGGGEGTGSVESNDCQAIVGWAQDPESPDASIPVRAFFGGAQGEPDAVEIEFQANVNRPDLCDQLGSCEHGFEIEVPGSLRDGTPHPVHVYAMVGGELAEIESSPATVQCAPPAFPEGIRRGTNPEILSAWGFSAFWDAIPAGPDVLANMPEREDMPEAVVLVRSDSGDPTVWLMDPGYKRRVDPSIAGAWGFDLATAEEWPDHVIADVEEGTPVRAEPFLVQSLTGQVYLVDDDQCAPDCGNSDDGTPDSGGDGDDEGDGDGGTGSMAGEGEGGSNAVPGGDGEGGDAGCGCQTTGSSPLWAVFPGLVLLGLRRRRRA